VAKALQGNGSDLRLLPMPVTHPGAGGQPCLSLMTTDSDARIHVAVAGQLVGPPRDGGHHCVFTNLSDRSNIDLIRTDLLSARPDLKKHTSIEFEVVEVSEVTGAADPRMVICEAQGLDIPLTLISTDLHQQMDRLPVEQGKRFRVALSRGFK